MKPMHDTIRKPVGSRLLATAVTFMALASPVDTQAQTEERTTITPAFREEIPNIPGKSLVGVVVSYAPGGKTAAHRHAFSAFVTGYVLSGSIHSQVDGGPVQVFHAGESWTEKPGARHNINENASATEPARLLAIFVVDAKEKELTTPWSNLEK
jgi:quercetin dioxygenase-like cupin family protein